MNALINVNHLRMTSEANRNNPLDVYCCREITHFFKLFR